MDICLKRLFPFFCFGSICIFKAHSILKIDIDVIKALCHQFCSGIKLTAVVKRKIFSIVIMYNYSVLMEYLDQVLYDSARRSASNYG